MFFLAPKDERRKQLLQLSVGLIVSGAALQVDKVLQHPLAAVVIVVVVAVVPSFALGGFGLAVEERHQEAQERHQLLGGILHRGALGESVRWQKYLVRGKDLLENRSGFLLTRQQQTVRCNEFIQVLVSESFGILENEASEHAMSWEHSVLPDIFSPSACAPHPQLDSQIQIS